MTTKFYFLKRIKIWLRRKQPSIIYNMMQELYDDARDEMQRAFEKSTVQMKAYQQELESRVARLGEFKYGTDEYKIRRIYTFPIMTQEEWATYRNIKYTAWLLELVMFLFDAYFGSLIVPFIIPHPSPGTQLALGGAIAALIIFCIHFGVNNLMSYLDGKRYLKTGELKDYDRSQVLTRLYTAIPLLSFGLAATVAIAMVREKLLSAVHLTGSATNAGLNELNDKVLDGSKFASIATLMLAFIVIFLFSYLRYKIRDYKLKAKMARAYDNNKRHIERLIKLIEALDTKFTSRIAALPGRAWSLMLHARRILKRTVDTDLQTKYEAYQTASEKPGFAITQDIFQLYRTVGAGDAELFVFGIQAHRDVPKMLAQWNDLMNAIKAKIAAYKAAHHFNPERQQEAVNAGFNLASITVALAFASVLSSCGYFGKPKPHKLSVLTFIDVSASTDTVVCRTYIRTIRELLDSLPAGSNIKVLPLNGATERSSKELINAAIPDEEMFRNDLDPPYQAELLKGMRFKGYKDSLAKALAGALEGITPLKASKAEGNETDVLGAFRLLPSYGESQDTSSRKMVVVFSDMLSCNKELDLERRTYSEDQLTNMVSNIPAVDLHSWHICIFTGEAKINNNQYMGVKHFWSQYLSKCRTEDVVYVSGSQELLLAKMRQLKKPSPAKTLL